MPAQIPKYQRETDQPLRCAISVYSQVIGKQQRYKPAWEMSAVWHDGEWILQMQTQEYDKTRVNIYVNETVMQAFSDKFAAEWAQWGGQKGSGRRADGYRPQDYYTIQVAAMTASFANDLDEKYTALQEQKRTTATNSRQSTSRQDDDDAMDGGSVPGVRLPKPKGDGRGANRRQQGDMVKVTELNRDIR